MQLTNLLKSDALIIEETQKSTRNEKKSGWIFLPIFYYTPETKTAFGAGGMYFFQKINQGYVLHTFCWDSSIP
jgi:hypothetical protein